MQSTDKTFYSASRQGFYKSAIHRDMPADVVEISEAERMALIDGQAAGKTITADAEGRPVLADPPAPTLDEAKAAKLAEINAAYSAELSSILADYPEAERLTWDRQEAEARAFTADDTAPTPYLDALAAARGLALSELVARIIAKADAWAAASATATGKRQRLEAEIEAAADAATLEKITW